MTLSLEIVRYAMTLVKGANTESILTTKDTRGKQKVVRCAVGARMTSLASVEVRQPLPADVPLSRGD